MQAQSPGLFTLLRFFSFGILFLNCYVLEARSENSQQFQPLHMQTNHMLLPVLFLVNIISAQWVVKLNCITRANSVPSVLLDSRFTDKNVYVLLFQVHAGMQAEMAAKAMFPASLTTGDSGTGGQGTSQTIWDWEGPKSITKTWALSEPVSCSPS